MKIVARIKPTSLVILLAKPISMAAQTATDLPLLPVPRPRKTIIFSGVFQESGAREDLRKGRGAHAAMIISGFLPTVFVVNCLIHMYVRCHRLDSARQVFDHFPHCDTVSCNILIAAYSRAGAIAEARAIFDAAPSLDVISWNSLISAYSPSSPIQSVVLFAKMRRSGVGPDRTTVAVALKSCASLGSHDLGRELHAIAVRAGLGRDAMAGTALVDLYAKLGLLSASLSLFHRLPEKNPVSWSAAIAGCVVNLRFEDAVKLFKTMLRESSSPASQSAYASAFKACASSFDLSLGMQLHAHAMKGKLAEDAVVGTAIVDMYAKCGDLEKSSRVFSLLPERRVQSWNAVLVGLGQKNQRLQAMELFKAMKREIDEAPDEITFSSVLRACAVPGGSAEGRQVHGLVLKSGFQSSFCAANAIIDMYGKCGMADEATAKFNEVSEGDAVSWNAIIAALEQNYRHEEALSRYEQMLFQGLFSPDEFTFGSVLKSCAGSQSLSTGKKTHGRIIKAGEAENTFLGEALVDMYAKLGILEDAMKLHERAKARTNVSWNAIISGFSLQRRSEEACGLFSSMLSLGLEPDNFTYATVLDICANEATWSLGKQIHGRTIKLGLHQDMYVASTVVDMYAKSGLLHESSRVFEELHEKDVVAWNAMVGGYAQHGLGEEALSVFAAMKAKNVSPNSATFVAVLRACAHVGSLEEGMAQFRSMAVRFGLEPRLEHYSCVVDLLARWGRPREAMELVLGMPVEADAVIWRTLLSGCKANGDVRTAALAAEMVLKLDPEDSAAYVLLSSVYAEAGRWGEVSRLRRTMKERRLKKEPGCSWLEMKGSVLVFVVGDEDRVCGDMRDALDALSREMKRCGYERSLDPFLLEE
ncbi:pentatricopeptide repeat-containing protein At3g02330, mitochondrial-like [Wolffia australiana]